MDRQGQIDAIEKTFKEANDPITKHHSKPNVHAVEVLSVFPDFKVFMKICRLIINEKMIRNDVYL